MIPLLTVNAFDLPKISGQPENEETKAIKSLEPKILELFSKQEAFAIFMGYGHHKEVLADPDFEPIISPLDCECRHWCDASHICGGEDCIRTQKGCGLVGLSACIYNCII